MLNSRRREIAAELFTLTASLASIAAALALILQIYHARSSDSPDPNPQPVASALSPTPPEHPPEYPAHAPPIVPPVDLTAQRLAPVEAETLACRAQLADMDARTRALQSSLEQLNRRIALTQRAEDQRLAQAQSHNRLVTERKQAVNQLERNRQALAAQVAEARAQRARAETRANHAQAILPFKGANGTWRRPIPIECKEDQAILQPGGEAFSLLELAPSRASMSGPLERALLRSVRKLQNIQTPDGKPAVPYILFLVRPDGIRAFYEARARLEQLGIAFGYELVDASALIDFPDLDDPREWSEHAPPFPQSPTPSHPVLLARPAAQPDSIANLGTNPDRNSAANTDPALQPWPVPADPAQAAAAGTGGLPLSGPPTVDLSRLRELSKNAGTGRQLGILPGQNPPSSTTDPITSDNLRAPAHPSAVLPTHRPGFSPAGSPRSDPASDLTLGNNSPPHGSDPLLSDGAGSPIPGPLPLTPAPRRSTGTSIAPNDAARNLSPASANRGAHSPQTQPGDNRPSTPSPTGLSPAQASNSDLTPGRRDSSPNDGRVEIFPDRNGLPPDVLAEFPRGDVLDPRAGRSPHPAQAQPPFAPPSSTRSAGAGVSGGAPPPFASPFAGGTPPASFSSTSLDLVNRSRSLEIVITCQNHQIIIRPGLMRIPLPELQASPDQVTEQLRDLFHAAWRASPETGIRPRILILVEPDGAPTYRVVRRQLTLAGVAWPMETRQAEPGTVDQFARSRP